MGFFALIPFILSRELVLMLVGWFPKVFQVFLLEVMIFLLIESHFTIFKMIPRGMVQR